MNVGEECLIFTKVKVRVTGKTGVDHPSDVVESAALSLTISVGGLFH